MIGEMWPHKQFLKDARAITRPNCLHPELAPSTANTFGCCCQMCSQIKYAYERLYVWSRNNGYKAEAKGRGRKPQPLIDRSCEICGAQWKSRVDREYAICKSCENRHRSIVRRFRKARIDPKKLVSLLLDQRCEICLKNMDGQSGQQWNLDHDHKISPVVTAESFRGVLCARCNTFVGYIEATPELVEPVKQYIICHAQRLRYER